jgi:hypothetical protein
VCDDGNTMDGDECSADCRGDRRRVVCGDGMVEGPEQCDDGNQVPATAARPTARSPRRSAATARSRRRGLRRRQRRQRRPNDFCKNDCTVFMPPPARRRPTTSSATQPQPRGQGRQDQRPQGDGHLQRHADNSVQISELQLQLANNAAWQVAKGFGSYKFDHDMDPNTPDKLLYSPREGDTFLMVSTGVIKAPNAQGIVIEANNSQVGNGDNGNDDGNALPAPLSTVGSEQRGRRHAVPGLRRRQRLLRHAAGPVEQGQQQPERQAVVHVQDQGPEGHLRLHLRLRVLLVGVADVGQHRLQRPADRVAGRPDADDPNADPPVDPYTGNVTFIPDPNDP